MPGVQVNLSRLCLFCDVIYRRRPRCGAAPAATNSSKVFIPLTLNTMQTSGMHAPDEPIDEPLKAYGLPTIYSYSYCSRAAPGVWTAGNFRSNRFRRTLPMAALPCI